MLGCTCTNCAAHVKNTHACVCKERACEGLCDFAWTPQTLPAYAFVCADEEKKDWSYIGHRRQAHLPNGKLPVKVDGNPAGALVDGTSKWKLRCCKCPHVITCTASR